MNYDFKDIDAASDCREIAKTLGLDINRDGRCAATWRGGTNPASVSFDADGKKWFDHSAGEGGGSVNLVMAITGKDMLEATSWLGEFYNLTPRFAPDRVKESMAERGFTETCRYDYTEKGVVVLQVVRFAHENGAKDFRQYDPRSGRWTGNADAPLYREDDVAESPWVLVVEGEKDADRCAAMGLPAVTCAGGSKKWADRHNKALAGKDVGIVADNDDAGQAHAQLAAQELRNHASSVRIITPSSRPKGDVSDYFDDGGTADGLVAMISAEQPVELNDKAAAIARAKVANETPFRNYMMVIGITEDGKPCKSKAPRNSKELMDNFFERFCGAPYVCGETLFDHDHDSREIEHLTSTEHLFAWMARLVGTPADWHAAPGFLTKAEFFRAVQKAAKVYNAIRTIPEHPRRAHVYYNVPDLPPPTPGYARFKELMAHFNPLVPEVDGPMLMAMFLAPSFTLLGGKPMFVVDSERRGSGKTTAVTVSSILLGRPVVEVSHQQLKRDEAELTNRLISAAARDACQVLIDNVDSSTASISGALSAAVTRQTISGRPKYGRGEVARPNDLTYYMTVNNATLTDDLAIRAYFVHLGYPKGYDSNFRSRVEGFARTHRLQIMADMIAMLEDHKPFEGVKPYTRFPEFETQVLQAACGDIETFSKCVDLLASRREEANVDEEKGSIIDDHFRHKLRGLRNVDPWQHVVFLRSQVALEWAREVDSSITLAGIRDLAKSGHSKSVAGKISAWPETRAPEVKTYDRRRGILWSPPGVTGKVQYLVLKVGTETKVQGVQA